MSGLLGVTRLEVPRLCAAAMHAHLAKVGYLGYEGLALWVGTQDGATFKVTQTVIPEQRHIRTSDGVCVITEAAVLHQLNVWLFKNKLVLAAQIHSHPGAAYHSKTDDDYAIATTVGSFSLVLPDFARAPFDLARAATYRLDQAGRWREVPPPAARRVIFVED